VPEPFIPKVGAKIMSLQEPTKKMSKSDPNEKATIFLTDSDAEIRNKIKRAVTDSNALFTFDDFVAFRNGQVDALSAGVRNLIDLNTIATSQEQTDQMMRSIQGYGDLKEAVSESLAEFIRPVRERYEAIRADEEALRETLKRGAEHARDRARKTLRKVYKKTGFVEL